MSDLTQLDGWNENPQSMDNPHSSFDGMPSSSSQGIRAAEVPKDVIIRILPFCTRREIIALVSLSRSFNKSITFHVLTRCGIRLKERASQVIVASPDTWRYPRWTHLAPHLLAIAMWIQSIKIIRYTIGFPMEEATRALRHLGSLIGRLPPSVDCVRINLHPMDAASCARIEPGFVNAENWDAAMRYLLQTVVRKRVKSLNISNGRCLPELLQLPGYKIIQGVLQPITDKASPPICTDQIAVSVPSPSPQAPPPEQSLTPPPRLEVSLPGPDATATRDHANSLPTLFKGLFATFSGRKRRKKPSVVAVPAFLPPDHVPAQHATTLQDSQEPTETPSPPGPLSASSAISNATDETPSHNTSSSDPVLEVLDLDSPYFFYTPQHRKHTLDFIKSQSTTLTSLTIGQVERTLTTATWKDILHATNIPTLTHFSISSGLFAETAGASIGDLDSFFRRHEGITHVEIYGMQRLSAPPVYNPKAVIKSPLLPNVTNISAHPWYIAMVVNQHTSASAGGSFRSSLCSVTVPMEADGRPSPGERFAYQTPPEEIVIALEAMGRLSTQSFSLIIPYPTYHRPSIGTYTKWMEAMIEQGKESICARLHNIQSVSIRPTSTPTVTHTLLTETYPAFFNLFPKLEEAHFKCYGVAEFSSRELEQLWQPKCPSIKRIRVEGLWRDESAPQVSVDQDTFISDQIVAMP